MEGHLVGRPRTICVYASESIALVVSLDLPIGAHVMVEGLTLQAISPPWTNRVKSNTNNE